MPLRCQPAASQEPTSTNCLAIALEMMQTQHCYFQALSLRLSKRRFLVEMFAADFLGNQIDAAMARMFSPLHKFLEMTEKRVAAQKEEDDYKRELQEKGVGERLRSDPMSIILEAKVFSAPFPAARSHKRCVIRITFNAGSR